MAFNEKEYARAYYLKHKERLNAASREYNRKHKERMKPLKRDAHIKRTYGLSAEEFDTLFASQHGRCGICLKEIEKLVVDHNHETKKVRGLLCHGCNTGIGLLADGELFDRAARWVKR